jgi:hypothetical protein
MQISTYPAPNSILEVREIRVVVVGAVCGREQQSCRAVTPGCIMKHALDFLIIAPAGINTLELAFCRRKTVGAFLLTVKGPEECNSVVAPSSHEYMDASRSSSQ